MQQVEERNLEVHRKKLYFEPYFVFRNNTLNPCPQMCSIFILTKIIFLVNNLSIFEEMPTVSKF